MLLVLTGNGKGKTTSAIGQAVRLVGEGKKVLMVQFIKGPWRSGEDEAYKRLLPDFKIVKKGLGFVGILGDSLPREAHVNAALDALSYALQENEKGAWHAIILDEINNAVHLNLIPIELLLKSIEKIQQLIPDIICTGRDAHPLLIEKADLVSEIKEIKHPYAKGAPAKKGIEY